MPPYFLVVMKKEKKKKGPGRTFSCVFTDSTCTFSFLPTTFFLCDIFTVFLYALSRARMVRRGPCRVDVGVRLPRAGSAPSLCRPSVRNTCTRLNLLRCVSASECLLCRWRLRVRRGMVVCWYGEWWCIFPSSLGKGKLGLSVPGWAE